MLAIGIASPMVAIADPPSPTYRQAVEDTIGIVMGARAGDTAAAQKAEAALTAGTGRTQPEIIAEICFCFCKKTMQRCSNPPER